MTRSFCIATTILFLFACSVNKHPSVQSDGLPGVTRFYCSDKKERQSNQSLDSEFFYSEMRICLTKGNYDSAVFLFSLAGSLSWYQAATDETGTLRDRHTALLSTYLQGIPPKHSNQFWMRVHENLGTPTSLANICNKLATFAPAIERQTPSSDYVTWKNALENYLHCLTVN